MQHFQIGSVHQSPIKKKVKLVKIEQTCAIGDVEVYSTEAICTRIIRLKSTSSIKIEDVRKYKFSQRHSLMRMEICD